MRRMNTCCMKTARKLWNKLSQSLHEGKTEESGGCWRCGAHITVKIEGAN